MTVLRDEPTGAGDAEWDYLDVEGTQCEDIEGDVPDKPDELELAAESLIRILDGRFMTRSLRNALDRLAVALPEEADAPHQEHADRRDAYGVHRA